MPVSASAGCKVNVTGKTGMHADAADRRVVAERRLPARFHAIHSSPAADARPTT